MSQNNPFNATVQTKLSHMKELATTFLGFGAKSVKGPFSFVMEGHAKATKVVHNSEAGVRQVSQLNMGTCTGVNLAIWGFDGTSAPGAAVQMLSPCNGDAEATTETTVSQPRMM